MSEDNPKVTIDGKEYAVPPLVPKQLKYVMPDLMQVMPVMVQTANALKAGEPSPLKTEHFEMLLKVIYWGVIWPNDPERNTPKGTAIKFADLENMNISFNEMMTIARVVQRQTGLYQTGAPPEGGTTGEAQPSG